MQILKLAFPPLVLLAAIVGRGIWQDRHPFFLFVAAVAGAGAVLCVAASLIRGVTPGGGKIAECSRVLHPFGYWFNVVGWMLCYLGALWLAWVIPPL